MQRFAAVLVFCAVQGDLSNGFSPLDVRSRHTRRRADGSTSHLQSVPTPLDVLTSGFASICRLPRGVTVSEDALNKQTPPPRLEQYFCIENDVECRKVSERITELDLCVDAVIPASPKSRAMTDPKYSYSLQEKDMKPPVLVVSEENTSSKRVLAGADEILEYLNAQYGVATETSEDDGTAAAADSFLKIVAVVGNQLATFLRIGRGQEVSKAGGPLAPRPAKPLILYDYAGNQFSRLVREVLTELDLVYEVRSVGKESPRREEMEKETGGSTQCPHLIDPNTSMSMKESSAIIEYLYETYGLYTPPSELLEWASQYILSPAKPILANLAKLQAGSSKEDEAVGQDLMAMADAEIQAEIDSAPVVVYSYDWSPFSMETRALLQRLDIQFTEISLGKEWIPGLIKAEGGSQKRAALLQRTGQSSLPHIFVGGKSIGGLFSGTPGLVPALAEGTFRDTVQQALNSAAAPAELEAAE